MKPCHNAEWFLPPALQVLVCPEKSYPEDNKNQAVLHYGSTIVRALLFCFFCLSTSAMHTVSQPEAHAFWPFESF